ncbi:MAG: hypothetical protein LUF27_17370 [Lachnospiraceae bacterium]|nr:hypothetical protein [Lachnospiraceae bacterium]
MYETAIRHWDGYWFGKRRMYGDTFPHYWSALTGNVFLRYAKITGDILWQKRGEDSLRGVLSLYEIKQSHVKTGAGCTDSDEMENAFDVKAGCAFVYPRTVNGKRAYFQDPWANDQDWGLYFYLREFG